MGEQWLSATYLGQTEDEVEGRYRYQLDYAQWWVNYGATHGGYYGDGSSTWDNITEEHLKLYFPNGVSQWLSNYIRYLKS